MITITARFSCLAALAITGAVLTACSSSAGNHSAQTVNGSSTVASGSFPVAGGTQAPGSSAASPDPCSLITDAEASSALGGPATHSAEGSRDASNGSGVVVTENRCNFKLVTSDQLGHDFYVAVYAGADRSYYEDSGTATDNPPISGLGDAAKGSSIDVKVYSKGVMLEVYGSVAAANGLQDIARLAIGKLQ